MANEMIKTIFLNFLIIQMVTRYGGICSEAIADESNNEAHHLSKITCLAHGTTECQEDNILSQDTQTASVILLHGLGSSGKKFKESVLFLKPGHSFRHIKMIFPTSPLIPYTPNDSNLSRAWFDKASSDFYSPEDPVSLKNGIQDIRELIQREISRGIAANRIVIGGFSLGGALSLNVAYRDFGENENSKKLAGVFALSACLHPDSSLYEELKWKNLENGPPLFYYHGTRDKQIPIVRGNDTFLRLTSLGIRGEFFGQKRLAHRISTKGVDKLFEWLGRVLP